MYTTRQKKNGFQPFVFLRTAWILTQCERTVCRQSNPNQKILYSVFLYSKVRQKVQIASDSPPIWILDSGFWILDSCALAYRSRPTAPHLDSGFWILNSVFLRSSVQIASAKPPFGFWILDSEFCIPALCSAASRGDPTSQRHHGPHPCRAARHGRAHRSAHHLR